MDLINSRSEFSRYDDMDYYFVAGNNLDEVIMIGDAVRADIIGAQRFGIKKTIFDRISDRPN